MPHNKQEAFSIITFFWLNLFAVSPKIATIVILAIISGGWKPPLQIRTSGRPFQAAPTGYWLLSLRGIAVCVWVD